MSRISGQPDATDKLAEPMESTQDNNMELYKRDAAQTQVSMVDKHSPASQNPQAHLDYGPMVVSQQAKFSYTEADMEECLLSTELETNSSRFEQIKNIFRGWGKNQWAHWAKQLAKEKVRLKNELDAEKARSKTELDAEKVRSKKAITFKSGECDHMSRQLGEKLRELDKRAKAYQTLLGDRNRIFNELSDTKRNQDEFQRKSLKDWENREAVYEQKIENLQMRDEERGKKVQDAQKAAQVMMDQNKSFAFSDDEIRGLFKARSDSWYAWAKDFAYGQLESIKSLPSNDSNELLQALKCFTELDNGKLPQDLIQGRKPNTVPYLLLHAMVADFISSEIFATPSWVLKATAHLILKDEKSDNKNNREVEDATSDSREVAVEASESEVRGSVLAENVSDLLNFLTGLHERDTQQWRAQMIRFFLINGIGDPPQNPKGLSASKSPKEYLITARSQYAAILVRKFVDGPARFLIDPAVLDAREGRLEEEMNLAMQLSARLWSQRSRVGCLNLQNFPARVFSASTVYLEAHQSQEKDIEPPNFYNGLPIAMVVQPAIVAFGTEEGQGYSDISRVWLKARVWVGGTEQRLREAEEVRLREVEEARQREAEKARQRELQAEEARQQQADEALMNVFWHTT